MITRYRFLFAGIVGTVILAACRVTRSPADVCTPHSFGIDTSQTEGAITCILGAAVGQTFMAEDSLVRSVTVWRPAWETYADGEKIWVTRVNSYGKPMIYPEGIILEGPSLDAFGDGVHPVKIQYVFEPPLSLPWRNGQFAFFVQDPCGTYTDLLVSHSNPYTGGRL